MLLQDRGCLHAKTPDVPEHARSFASHLVNIICDYRIRPDLPMPVKLGEKEKIVWPISLQISHLVQLQIGLSGRLIDYYPKVEFIVWRRDRCPDMFNPSDLGSKELMGSFPFWEYKVEVFQTRGIRNLNERWRIVAGIKRYGQFLIPHGCRTECIRRKTGHS